MERLIGMIGAKLDSGTLPAGLHIKRWGSYGRLRRRCSACDEPILPAEVAPELEFEDRLTIDLHAGCAGLYEAALRRRRRRAA